MQSFLNFFEFMPAWQKGFMVVFSLSFCWVLESKIPLFPLRYSKLRHGALNLTFFLCISLINVAYGLFLLYGLEFFHRYEMGLLHWLRWPAWIEVLISVLALDLVAQYLVHICLHKVPWMWRFHRIHHSDMHLDATSGTRHHPGDYVLRELFSFVLLVVMGIPAAHYFVFRFVTIFFTYFNHANVKLPKVMNKILSPVFITPDLHKIHHHYKQPWTDSNYGNIFSFWDRLFGTLVRKSSLKVRYGLDELGLEFRGNLKDLILMPWSLKKSLS